MKKASGLLESGKATLRIDGNDGDLVIFRDKGWTRLETTRNIDGSEYAVFDHADARIVLSLAIADGGLEVFPLDAGGARSDTLTGTDLGDKIFGKGGNDRIEGKGGADTIDGGPGTDTASYKSSGSGVEINLAIGTASGGHAEGDTLIGIENLDGSNHGDRLTGDAGANTLRGMGGARHN